MCYGRAKRGLASYASAGCAPLERKIIKDIAYNFSLDAISQFVMRVKMSSLDKKRVGMTITSSPKPTKSHALAPHDSKAVGGHGFCKNAKAFCAYFSESVMRSRYLSHLCRCCGFFFRLSGLSEIRNRSRCLANFRFQLLRHLRIRFQELLGILASLADAGIVI